jgi:antitoxin (DNA-binding transcriptional repressor) of toxin-antitoxin stability system
MKSLSTEQLLGDLAKLVWLIKQGEELALMENGKEIATIIPRPVKPCEPRPFGLAKGQFVVPPDFNAPLPEVVLLEFEGA